MSIVINRFVIYTTIVSIAIWVAWTMFFVSKADCSIVWWIGDIIVNRSVVIAMLLITSFSFLDFAYRLFAWASAIYVFWLCMYEVLFILKDSGVEAIEISSRDFHLISVVWFMLCSIILIIINVSKRNR